MSDTIRQIREADPNRFDPDDLEWLVHFKAKWEPIRRDDLVPGAEDWGGRVLTWQAAWRIDPEDDIEGYTGEHACSPILRDGDPRPPFAWVPSCDLVRVGS